tara:strand:+ start:220 stop:2829 length:2610 start_codon:yes stop_codon:yes gene_type:complete
MSQPQAKRLSDYCSPLFTISHVDLTFRLADECTQVQACMRVERCGDHLEPLTLDGEELKLISIAIDGEPLDEQIKVTSSQLILDTDKSDFELLITTEINPKANTKLEGIYLSDGAFCSQCEAEGFRRITYFLDRPDVLATYKVRIEAEKSRFPYLLSNGNAVDQGELDDGYHFMQWYDPFPKPCYLFALVAGDFDLLEDHYTTGTGRDILLQIFVDKGQKDKAYHAMESLKRAMLWDEQRFSLEYDLDIYMIVAVDFFNMGAMENKGLNVFNSKFVLANRDTATDDDYHYIESVIGHEYFHNWTGNRVTCRDWFQLSLKEGLTVFRDQEFSSDLGSRTVNRIDAVKAIRNHQFAEDAGPMAHPIRPESVIEMNNFYTSTVYEKGAEVIRMMHTLLGETLFQKGMKLYIQRHDGHAVTCDDFVAAMQDASGVDLTQFKRWYAQAGTPVVTFSDHYDSSKNTYSMTFSQYTPETADGSPKQDLHIPVVVELLDKNGASIALPEQASHSGYLLNLKQKEQTFTYDHIKEKPTVSLFCNFSAPIKLNYDESEHNLAHIMRYAQHEMSRWDACQTLASREILKGVKALQQEQKQQVSPVFIDAIDEVLRSTTLDPALIAEILHLPSEVALVEMMTEVDTENLHRARRHIMHEIVVQLEDVLLEVYQRAHQVSEQSEQGVAARALKNICLSYLALMPKHLSGIVKAQYEQASNMTEQLGALRAANMQDSAERDAMMSAFERQWSQLPLVMDKWFALQATLPSDKTLSRVKRLLNHQAFTLKNPNRVRALIGSFASANPYLFHAKDGSGYVFLFEQLKHLNTINPQVAARLITPLTQWKKQPLDKQVKMKNHLQELLDLDHLAKDLYEKTFKSLQQ